ncbi:FtsX-like permease family protein [Aliiglaciecola sp. SL4]|uniref:ABC transporter permease n=1 Tax=Aliiglaciecola sp. SL4 TaxID=3239806 RepID=UPI00355BDB37
MTKPILSVLWVIVKSYNLQKYRLFLVLMAMIIGCAGFSSVLVINETAKRSYNQPNFPLIEDVRYAIYPKEGASITQSDYADLRKSGNRNIIAVSTLEIGSKNNKLDFVGVDYYALMSLDVSQQGTDSAEKEVVLFTSSINSSEIDATENKFIVDPAYAKVLRTQKLLTSDNFLQLNSQFPIGPVSIAKGTGFGQQIVCDIETLFNQFTTQEISYLVVVGKYNDKNPVTVQLPAHLKLVKLISTEDTEQLTASFHLNLFAMGLLMFVVCMFVVLNALNLLIIKRLPTFKIIRQLGVPIVAIFSASIIEMLFLAIVCSAMGVTLGIEAAKLLSPAVNQTLESLYNVSLGFESFSWPSLYSRVLLASILGLSLAAVLPLRSIDSHLASIKLTPQVVYNENRWLTVSAILLLVSLILYFCYANILSSFVIIGLLITSGCFMVLFILPKLLVLTQPFIPSNAPSLSWSFADAKRVSNKSSIALCAFFIAVTANVGMNLMVNSFRVATDTWITQRLDADAYIYTQDADKASTLIKLNFPKISTFVRLAEKVSYQGNDLQIRSYPSQLKHRQALLLEDALDTSWDKFSNGYGIFVNQQFALSKQLKLGQKLEISRQDNTQLAVQVVGIYYDYGNPNAQALVSEWLIKNPLGGRQVMALYNQGAHPLEWTELKKQLGLNMPDAQMMETQTLLKASMQTFDNTFVVTQSLNIITLLVAAFSLASSLIVIDFDNKPQRALLRAMGVPASKVLLLTLFQYTLLCLFICAIAIPFGILLSWLLINLINVQAFYWSYPLVIELETIVQLVFSSLTVVLLAVLLPAARAILIPPIEDIKWLNG